MTVGTAQGDRKYISAGQFIEQESASDLKEGRVGSRTVFELLNEVLNALVRSLLARSSDGALLETGVRTLVSGRGSERGDARGCCLLESRRLRQRRSVSSLAVVCGKRRCVPRTSTT